MKYTSKKHSKKSKIGKFGNNDSNKKSKKIKKLYLKKIISDKDIGKKEGDFLVQKNLNIK